MENKEFIWSEKYRPHKIEDTILPKHLKDMFLGFLKQNNIPNMILCGTSGVGKTTVARALLEELGADYIIINGSLDRGIDILRTQIMNFASAVSFSGGRKYVIIDEADYLNATSTQPALRNFIETFSENCGFIFTCNYKNRLIKELHSRATVIDFTIPKNEMGEIAKSIYMSVCSILGRENIKYDKSSVIELIKKYFPDQRRIIGELQRYSASGQIDYGVLTNTSEQSIKELFGFLSSKNFTAMRKWVAESMTDHTTLFRELYDHGIKYISMDSSPQLVIIIADYQYKSAFVADQEINMVSCLTEIMMNCGFNVSK